MKNVKNFIGHDGFQWWVGVVEDRNDPEKIGRCRVRIFGIHAEDISLIPTEDLPWAVPIYSVNSSDTFSAPKEGEFVMGFFLDGSFCQSPAILGVIPGFNRQTPRDGAAFVDVRNAEKIRNSPKKPSAIDYPEARSGDSTAISGNIINDGLGATRVATDNIMLYVPLSLVARSSLTDEFQSLIGYNHKFTQQELSQGYITLSISETIRIDGINGIKTTITKDQAKKLLDIDIQKTITQARDSIGATTWDSLTVPQKAGLILNAYHLGSKTNFENSGVRSAIINGDIIKAAQIISYEMLRSPTGQYLRSEDTLAHVAASLFKSIPRSNLIAARANTASNTNPLIVAGAGIGIQIHESNLSDDIDAKSLRYPSLDEIGKTSLSTLVSNDHKTLLQKFRESTPISAVGAYDESWTEPSPAFSAQYPHNKARETESGHIFEMDDTPGNERVQISHRSGSFQEWYPSGTKVEKVVKNNYKLVLSDDFVYVAGKVNIVIESNTNIRIVGSCNLQVENDLNATVNGNVNYSVGNAFNIKANTLKFDIAQTSTIMAASHSNTGSSLSLTAPPKRGSPTVAQKFLEIDKTVKLIDEIRNQNNEILRNFLKNPRNYPAIFKNTKQFIAPAPQSGSDLIYRNTVGESLIVINNTADIALWFEKQLFFASNGYWRETGVEISGVIQPSNLNIIDLWRNLGFPREYWTLSDQTNWTMAFINYGLKQNGYRYVQTPHPQDIELRFNDYQFSRVKPEDARPGDIVLWTNKHVNFVYKNMNGALTFIGACQPPNPSLNIGDGRIGDVSIVTDGGSSIVAIVRPSKV